MAYSIPHTFNLYIDSKICALYVHLKLILCVGRKEIAALKFRDLIEFPNKNFSLPVAF